MIEQSISMLSVIKDTFPTVPCTMTLFVTFVLFVVKPLTLRLF